MKSIYFLRYFFSFGCFIVVITYVAMGIGLLANIIFDMGTFDLLLFSGIGEATTELNYSLGGELVETATASVDIKISHIASDNTYVKVLGFVNLTVMCLLSYFALKYLSNLFYNFSEVNSWGGYFTKENYLSIRRIAYLTLGGTLYGFLVNSIFSWVLIKDLSVLGESLQLHPDIYELASLITVLVLFGALRIFKAAIEMKEESEFTI